MIIVVMMVVVMIIMVSAIVTMPRRSHHASDATDDTTRCAADDAAHHAAYRSRRASPDLGPSFTTPNNALGLCRQRRGEQGEEARGQYHCGFHGRFSIVLARIRSQPPPVDCERFRKQGPYDCRSNVAILTAGHAAR